MSKSELPERVDAYKLADQTSTLDGEIAFGRMARLANLVVEESDAFKAQLRFDRDSEQRRVVSGWVEGRVALECQRCLRPVHYDLHSRFDLAIVYNDEMARALPGSLEPLMLLPDQSLDVAELVEEELLLSLPIKAVHDPNQCQIQTEFKPDEQDDRPGAEKDNPFKVLESLKRS
ncbi:MAG: YceD family protein [Saccharospirillum sp.]